MAHGQPDFGMYAQKTTTYSLSDMGELAARLGSIVTFDRRGDIVFADDFSHGLAAYTTSTSGTGASVTQSALRAKADDFSLNLVAGSTSLKRATLNKYLPYPIVSNLGIEVSFTVHADTDRIVLSLFLYSGVTALIAALNYYPTTEKLNYYSSAGSYIELESGLSLKEADYMFHTLKLVVDFVNEKYVRLLLDHLSWDMSALDIYSVASSADAYMHLDLSVFSDSGKNASIYLDNLIITQNEPD